jgi:hypothetical protein
MKKVITILMVLCVSVALFASAGSIKVGGAFNFISGGTKDFVLNEITLPDSSSSYKSSGVGFDIGGSFDVSKDLKAWADFNMVFGFDAKLKEVDQTEWSSMNDLYKEFKDLAGDKAYKKLNMISAAAGVAYKLGFDAPVDVSVGGGVFFERVFGRVGAKDESSEIGREFKAINLGVSLYADVEYKFNDNFGIGLTVMPHFGVYNSSTAREIVVVTGTDKSVSMTAKGINFSFSMPVSLGATYSF